MKLYQITLLDQATVPFYTGSISYYTYDIDDFQKRWMNLESDKERVERFIKSRHGEFVSDSYKPVNIVQYDSNSTVYKSKEIHFNNRNVVLCNDYGCESTYRIRQLNIEIQWIRYENSYIKMARFDAEGIAEISPIADKFVEMSCYGNPILETEYQSKKYISDELVEFDNDKVRSIVFIPVKFFKNQEKMMNDENITDKELQILMKDIPGEAG